VRPSFALRPKLLHYEAALVKLVFIDVQIAVTLLPAADRRAMAASAMKANRSEYSTRSCPSSSFAKRA
jgi:hypothetical protein